jgi:hypothetical protein
MNVVSHEMLKRFFEAQDGLVLQASDLSLGSLAEMVHSSGDVGDAPSESLVATKAADGSFQYRCVKGSGADSTAAAGLEAY